MKYKTKIRRVDRLDQNKLTSYVFRDYFTISSERVQNCKFKNANGKVAECILDLGIFFGNFTIN